MKEYLLNKFALFASILLHLDHPKYRCSVTEEEYIPIESYSFIFTW